MIVEYWAPWWFPWVVGALMVIATVLAIHVAKKHRR